MYGIKIDPGSGLSITRQLCSQIRTLIESGELKSGTLLPPTRKIASELNINRNTMVEVYEQLIAEGYLEGYAGSGTYVSSGINRGVAAAGPAAVRSAHAGRAESLRRDVINFETGIPDLATFPARLWGKYLKQAAENPSYMMESFRDTAGDLNLRNILSQYLFRVKGIRCHPEQIMIVSGSSEGFLLIARAFSGVSGTLFIEDPTVDFTRSIFHRMNYRINPMEVDRNGMNIPEANTAPAGSLILLTPSHQFPTGSILSIQRRLQAVRLAELTESYIIEDDYDSEFRFKGIPIPPLQVLSPSRVIYVGTFSKTLFPGLRLGFMILPEQLVDLFKEVKDSMNMLTPVIEQRTLANFIRDGHLDRHIYKMKNTYKKRRSLLVSHLNKYFGNDISILGDESGMHMQAAFNGNGKFPDIHWEDTVKYGVKVESIEEYCLIKGNNRNRIVLGYGNTAAGQLEEGIKRLRQFMMNTI